MESSAQLKVITAAIFLAIAAFSAAVAIYYTTQSVFTTQKLANEKLNFQNNGEWDVITPVLLTDRNITILRTHFSSRCYVLDSAERNGHSILKRKGKLFYVAPEPLDDEELTALAGEEALKFCTNYSAHRIIKDPQQRARRSPSTVQNVPPNECQNNVIINCPDTVKEQCTSGPGTTAEGGLYRLTTTCLAPNKVQVVVENRCKEIADMKSLEPNKCVEAFYQKAAAELATLRSQAPAEAFNNPPEPEPMGHVHPSHGQNHIGGTPGPQAVPGPEATEGPSAQQPHATHASGPKGTTSSEEIPEEPSVTRPGVVDGSTTNKGPSVVTSASSEEYNDEEEQTTPISIGHAKTEPAFVLDSSKKTTPVSQHTGKPSKSSVEDDSSSEEDHVMPSIGPTQSINHNASTTNAAFDLDKKPTNESQAVDDSSEESGITEHQGSPKPTQAASGSPNDVTVTATLQVSSKSSEEGSSEEGTVQGNGVPDEGASNQPPPVTPSGGNSSTTASGKNSVAGLMGHLTTTKPNHVAGAQSQKGSSEESKGMPTGPAEEGASNQPPPASQSGNHTEPGNNTHTGDHTQAASHTQPGDHVQTGDHPLVVGDHNISAGNATTKAAKGVGSTTTDPATQIAGTDESSEEKSKPTEPASLKRRAN